MQMPGNKRPQQTLTHKPQQLAGAAIGQHIQPAIRPYAHVAYAFVALGQQAFSQNLLPPVCTAQNHPPQCLACECAQENIVLKFWKLVALVNGHAAGGYG